MSSKTTTYQVNQKIVYPSQGVGKITDICKKKFREKEQLYYIIYLEVSDMTVMVPTDKVEELGIRAIVSADEARRALELISEDFEPIPSDWKLRYQMNLDLLKKGSVIDIATIVRSLYHRSKVKELPILERKLYDSAKKLLEDEISFALDKPVKEVETLIHSRLEPLDESGEPKRVPVVNKVRVDDDDDFDQDEEIAIEDDDDSSDDEGDD